MFSQNKPILPPDFINRMIAVHGKAGEAWIKRMPELRTQILEQWNLKGGDPILPLSYNYLELTEDKDGKGVILKLGFPNPELTTEILALRHYNGKGSVRLFEANPQLGALLLERILPGTSLLAIKDDEEATQIASQVMRGIRVEAPESGIFPTVADWCRGFERYWKQFPASSGPLPEKLVSQAEKSAEDLLHSQDPPLLLHGDLHHQNILQGESGSWIAIDPKGVIGEPCFEIGPLMINPFPNLIRNPNLDQLLSRRLDILEQDLKLDRWRIAAWSFVRAVLSAVWDVEDGTDNWQCGITCAEHLSKLIP
jgi:streptomycin 6-kinase